MKLTRLALAALALFAFAHTPAHAEGARVRDMVLGKADAPITVIEYASFTCSHCADFYNDVMPELEKRYVETGKVKFIFREYPVDGFGLKAATIARCLPEEQFFPFVKIMFKNFRQLVSSPKPEDTLMQFASMSGLPPEKAKACLDDTKLMDELVEQRTVASDKYNITGTPAFIINNGEEKIIGGRPVEDFTKVFDKLLAKKK